MKTLKKEAEHYSECHQDVSEELGKYLVSAVFQDGANQAEKIRAQIEVLQELLSADVNKINLQLIMLRLGIELKQLENESKTD